MSVDHDSIKANDLFVEGKRLYDVGKYEGGKKWIRQGSGENGEEGMSTWSFGFGNIDGVYTPKANVDLDAVMELWLQQIRETPAGQNVWHNLRA